MEAELIWFSKGDAIFALNEKVDRVENLLERVTQESDLEAIWQQGKYPSRPDPTNRRETQVGLRRDQIKRLALPVPVGTPEPPADDNQEQTRFGEWIGKATEEHLREVRRNSYWLGRYEESARLVDRLLNTRIAATG